MILSIAHAAVDDAAQDNLFGAWSNLIVGDHPDGLVDAYLLEAEGVVQIVSIWQTSEHHDTAVRGEEGHLGLRVFAACGVEPSHDVYSVVGRLK